MFIPLHHHLPWYDRNQFSISNYSLPLASILLLIALIVFLISQCGIMSMIDHYRNSGSSKSSPPPHSHPALPKSAAPSLTIKSSNKQQQQHQFNQKRPSSRLSSSTVSEIPKSKMIYSKMCSRKSINLPASSIHTTTTYPSLVIQNISNNNENSISFSRSTRKSNHKNNNNNLPNINLLLDPVEKSKSTSERNMDFFKALLKQKKMNSKIFDMAKIELEDAKQIDQILKQIKHNNADTYVRQPNSQIYFREPIIVVRQAIQKILNKSSNSSSSSSNNNNGDNQ